MVLCNMTSERRKEVFILTNDDGIEAEGIRVLKEIVEGEKIIVAPAMHVSGCSHQITTRYPLTLEEVKPGEYAVNGTPVDCVRLAVSCIAPASTWVLSGINAGGNLGVDIYVSGTVAAVREAAILGLKGIAFSHLRKRPKEIDWQLAKKLAARVLAELLPKKLPKGCFWNVNLPHLEEDCNPEIVFCKPSIDPLPIQFKKEGNSYWYKGEYLQRKRTEETDVDVCFSGKIAVSLISISNHPHPDEYPQ